MKGEREPSVLAVNIYLFYYVYLTVEEEKQPIESCCLDFERRQRAQTDKITFVRTFCFEL